MTTIRKCLAVGLSGAVVGLVFYVITGVSMAVFASDAVAILESATDYPKQGGLFFLVADVLMGVWTMAIYELVSARSGKGIRAALIAGLLWWAMKTLQSAHWIGIGFVPLSIVPESLAVSLVCSLLATMVGAVLYDKAAASWRHG